MDGKGGAEPSVPTAEPPPRKGVLFRTPPCLRAFLADAGQGLWQDVRENRFKACDNRDGSALTFTDFPEYARNNFSHSYGELSKRTHREALQNVISWLFFRERLVSGNHAIVAPEVPPEGTESEDLRAVLAAPIASAYYNKR